MLGCSPFQPLTVSRSVVSQQSFEAEAWECFYLAKYPLEVWAAIPPFAHTGLRHCWEIHFTLSILNQCIFPCVRGVTKTQGTIVWCGRKLTGIPQSPGDDVSGCHSFCSWSTLDAPDRTWCQMELADEMLWLSHGALYTSIYYIGIHGSASHRDSTDLPTADIDGSSAAVMKRCSISIFVV